MSGRKPIKKGNFKIIWLLLQVPTNHLQMHAHYSSNTHRLVAMHSDESHTTCAHISHPRLQYKPATCMYTKTQRPQKNKQSGRTNTHILTLAPFMFTGTRWKTPLPHCFSEWQAISALHSRSIPQEMGVSSADSCGAQLSPTALRSGGQPAPPSRSLSITAGGIWLRAGQRPVALLTY